LAKPNFGLYHIAPKTKGINETPMKIKIFIFDYFDGKVRKYYDWKYSFEKY